VTEVITAVRSTGRRDARIGATREGTRETACTTGIAQVGRIARADVDESRSRVDRVSSPELATFDGRAVGRAIRQPVAMSNAANSRHRATMADCFAI
jgi:hypothetical protein